MVAGRGNRIVVGSRVRVRPSIAHHRGWFLVGGLVKAELSENRMRVRWPDGAIQIWYVRDLVLDPVISEAEAVARRMEHDIALCATVFVLRGWETYDRLQGEYLLRSPLGEIRAVRQAVWFKVSNYSYR